MGALQHRLRRYPQAVASFARLVSVAPEYPFARANLHLSRIYGCDWTGYDEDVAAIVADLRAGKPACEPFAALASLASPHDQLRAARAWGAAYHPPPPAPPHDAARAAEPGARIRLAYLSADFRDHAMAVLMAGLFERHDRARFETTAISFGPPHDGPMRRRLIAAFDHFVDVHERDDREVAALLRERGIDIAVDLNGYTQGARPAVLAARPAPVQVNYLGYPGTLGVAWIDYIIADRIVIPPQAHDAYDECVVTLPDSYQPNDRSREMFEPTPTRAEVGLPATGFVFCCFNNNFKITPGMFGLWMDVLREVAGSVLWLLGVTETAAANLRAAAAAHDVDPQRLVFAPRIPGPEHLARHRLAELFLDTLPYAAHTTASDALWTGLPVLTCLGSSFAGRVAGSLLHAAGVPELVCGSLEEYRARAIALARDPAELRALRARLAAGRENCPLFDADRYTRHMEAAFLAMWQRRQRGEPPAGFAVA